MCDSCAGVKLIVNNSCKAGRQKLERLPGGKLLLNSGIRRPRSGEVVFAQLSHGKAASPVAVA